MPWHSVTAMVKAELVAVFGARGTGKTAWIRQRIDQQRPQRLAVWDFKHDPALRGLGTDIMVRSADDLTRYGRALKAPSFRVVLMPDSGQALAEQFELFCLGCWFAGNLTMFVDELPEVTKANRAPPAWRRCVNVGRDYTGPDGQRRALTIIGAGQRPAECDKSFIANADIVHSGRLGFKTDARELAEVLNASADELMRLPDLHWIERRAGQVEPERGVLSFSNKSLQKKVPAAAPGRRGLRRSA